MLVAPSEELLTETNSHIVRAELGAGAVFSGITTRTWLAERGLLKAEDVLNIARPDSGPYLVSTTAIAIENTHNFGGGTVQPIAEIKKLRQETQKLGVSMHLDGARIWNAHVATGIDFKEYGKYFDTLSVCLSKGLGAPIGSLMISSKERITNARQWRKRYGGGMRQVGQIAAAGHYALEYNIKCLKNDHLRAKSIAEAASKIAPAVITPNLVETNIVGLDLSSLNITSQELATQLKEKGILTGPLGPKYLRLVTHLDLDESDIDLVNQVLPEILKSALVRK
jgi:threonine aldolase